MSGAHTGEIGTQLPCSLQCTIFQEPPYVQLCGSSLNFNLLHFYGALSCEHDWRKQWPLIINIVFSASLLSPEFGNSPESSNIPILPWSSQCVDIILKQFEALPVISQLIRMQKDTITSETPRILWALYQDTRSIIYFIISQLLVLWVTLIRFEYEASLESLA
jgi:hypothetical protein